MATQDLGNAEAGSDVLLEVKNLKVYYRTSTTPVRAVDDVSFELKQKEVLGLAGESGCGKSTLAMGLLKLVEAPAYIAGGKVIFRGKDLMSMSDEQLRKIRWRHIAFSPQSSMNALNPVARVYDQFTDAMSAHRYKVPERKPRKYVSGLLKAIALSPRIHREYASELSGGMRQRVIISMGMSLNPELIIADEPTSSLDVVVQRGVLELLTGLRDERRTSILLVSHDIATLFEVVDRLAIIYAGKLMEIQSVFDIYDEPLHPYTKGLIDSVPSLEKKEIPRSIPGLPPDLKNPPTGCRFHPRCAKAMEICRQKEPESKDLGHEKCVACHLYS
nr:ABC transporter ATP-binding protein [Candidatus Njordarchaeum guaymaensis]